MYYETTFGRLSGRQLTLRWIVPLGFQRWSERGWVFAPLRLFSLRSWWRSIFSRWNYDWWVCYRSGDNHRCYCQVGTLFDGKIQVAGWGLVWFYQNYTGPTPCACDEAYAEWQDEQDDSEVGATP